MTIVNIIGIAGVVGTLSFGLLSIYIFLKSRRRGQMVLAVEETIGLVDKIARNLPNLSILHQNKPVSEGIVFLKAALINYGSKDITKAMIYETPCVVLPEGFRWLEWNVDRRFSDIEATMSVVNETKLVPEFSLLKVNERIRFEALAEVPADESNGEPVRNPGETLKKNLNLEYRIQDAAKAKNIIIPPAAIQKETRAMAIVLAVVFILVAGLSAYGLYAERPLDIAYVGTNKAGEDVKFKMIPNRDGKFEFYEIEESLWGGSIAIQEDPTYTLTPKELADSTNFKPTAIERGISKVMIFMPLFFIAMMLALFASIYLVVWSKRRIIRLTTFVAK